jgi:hypothetical protein
MGWIPQRFRQFLRVIGEASGFWHGVADRFNVSSNIFTGAVLYVGIGEVEVPRVLQFDVAEREPFLRDFLGYSGVAFVSFPNWPSDS